MQSGFFVSAQRARPHHAPTDEVSLQKPSRPDLESVSEREGVFTGALFVVFIVAGTAHRAACASAGAGAFACLFVFDHFNDYRNEDSGNDRTNNNCRPHFSFLLSD